MSDDGFAPDPEGRWEWRLVQETVIGPLYGKVKVACGCLWTEATEEGATDGWCPHED